MKYPAKDVYDRKRTPYAVYCYGPDYTIAPGCGLVYLTEEEYTAQMMAAHKTWCCPHCWGDAQWQDGNYEQQIDVVGEA